MVWFYLAYGCSQENIDEAIKKGLNLYDYIQHLTARDAIGKTPINYAIEQENKLFLDWLFERHLFGNECKDNISAIFARYPTYTDYSNQIIDFNNMFSCYSNEFDANTVCDNYEDSQLKFAIICNQVKFVEENINPFFSANRIHQSLNVKNKAIFPLHVAVFLDI